MAPPQRVPVDPDKGIPDLFKQLGDDGKRLVADEVRLAKLEASETVHRATSAAIALGIALGVAVFGLIAFTLFVATAFGAIANGHYWVGAMLAGAIEMAVGLWFLEKGMKAVKSAPYSMPETRASLKLTK